jgi:hypothetical protein
LLENKYSLEIISSEGNRKYKTHNVGGINTIGVYENEPFKIRFKNNSFKKVQVRVSVDGTDVLTGEKASTATLGRMWVVNGYETLELKAWPEDNEGGSEFLFGHADDSVAAHTHGDMSAKGLIAVAVFEEGYVETPKTIFPQWGGRRYKLSASRNRSYSKSILRGGSSNNPTYDLLGEKVDCCEQGPAVGAGDYQDQKITKVAGLTTPEFKGIVQVKYEWWTNLKSKLRNVTPKHQAFPGDKGIDLKSTPKLETPGGRKRRIRRNLDEGTRLRPEEKYIEYDRFG